MVLSSSYSADYVLIMTQTAAMLLYVFARGLCLAQLPAIRHKFHVSLLASNFGRIDFNYNVLPSAHTVPSQSRMVGLL